MKFSRRYSIIKGELNIAPLIDVVFLQLIYFMLTSSFIMQPGLKINLPQAATSETLTKKEVIVDISKEGAMFSENPVSIEELEAIFGRPPSNTDAVLIIKSDQKTEHGIVVGVMDSARKSE